MLDWQKWMLNLNRVTILQWKFHVKIVLFDLSTEYYNDKNRVQFNSS